MKQIVDKKRRITYRPPKEENVYVIVGRNISPKKQQIEITIKSIDDK